MPNEKAGEVNKDFQLSNLLERLSINNLNPDAEVYNPIDQTAATKDVPKTRQKQVPVGKQRKSNVNIENPDKEFLKSQLDTCKGMIAQKDLEVKKLKESNDMRAKRISALESLLQESREFIIKGDTQNQNLKNPETFQSGFPTVNVDNNKNLWVGNENQPPGKSTHNTDIKV